MPVAHIIIIRVYVATEVEKSSVTVLTEILKPAPCSQIGMYLPFSAMFGLVFCKQLHVLTMPRVEDAEALMGPVVSHIKHYCTLHLQELDQGKTLICG